MLIFFRHRGKTSYTYLNSIYFVEEEIEKGKFCIDFFFISSKQYTQREIVGITLPSSQTIHARLFLFLFVGVSAQHRRNPCVVFFFQFEISTKNNIFWCYLFASEYSRKFWKLYHHYNHNMLIVVLMMMMMMISDKNTDFFLSVYTQKQTQTHIFTYTKFLV